MPTPVRPPEAKYLGIWLDDNLIFGEHVRRAREKAERSLAALMRLMPNVGGLGPASRVMLYCVVQFIVLYEQI